MITKKIDKISGCWFLDENDKILIKTVTNGSPTSNCQVASFSLEGDNFHKLNDKDIEYMFKRIANITYKKLFLFSSSKKRQINRLLNFIENNNKINLKIHFENKKGNITLLIHSTL